MTSAADRRLQLCAGGTDSGIRLDRFLAARLPQAEMSRARLQALVRGGFVLLAPGAGGAAQVVRDNARRIRPGDRLTVSVPEAEEAALRPQAMALSILHEDADLIVVDKPAGLVVHPGPGHRQDTLVNALLAHCGDGLSPIGGVLRPGIVHRLDKDTSGLMVAAKNAAAHRSLAGQFAAHGADGDLERVYLALVRGVPGTQARRIEAAIGRHPVARKKMAVRAGAGRPAVTCCRVLRRFGDQASLLSCALRTGRTHQIRVHLAHIGHPVIGDPVYGGRRAGGAGGLERQALHAGRLGFRHPSGGRRMRFESPPPADMRGLIEALSRL